MSKINVSNLSHAGNGGDPNIELYADGSTSIRSLNNARSTVIINGEMMINQRFTEESFPSEAGGSGGSGSARVVCPDRYVWVNNFTSDYNAQVRRLQISDSSHGPEGAVMPPGFNFCVSVKPLQAKPSFDDGDYLSVTQFVEGYNISNFDLGKATAQTMNFSFWYRTNKAGTYGLCFRNRAAERTYVHDFVVSAGDADNTWRQYDVDIPGPTNGEWDIDSNIGFRCEIFFANAGQWQTAPANADQWLDTTGGIVHTTSNIVNFMDDEANRFATTGWQLTAGAGKLSFQHHNSADELLLCQRYCYRINASGDGFAGGTRFTKFAWLRNSGGSDNWVNWALPVNMRTRPSLAMGGNIASPATGRIIDTSQVKNVMYAGSNLSIDLTNSAGFAADYADFIQLGETGSWFMADCEF